MACRLASTFPSMPFLPLAWRSEMKSIKFSPFEILDLSHRLLTLESYSTAILKSLQCILIKGGEHIRKDFELHKAQGLNPLKAGRESRQRVSISGRKPYEKAAMNAINEAFHQASGKLCAYCSQPQTENLEADMVLQCGLRHGGIDSTRKKIFWKAAFQAGLCVPSCKHCNQQKGVFESRAWKIWRSLRHGKATLQLPELPPLTQPDIIHRKLNARGIRPMHQPYTVEDLANIGNALVHLSLRMTAPCGHHSTRWNVEWFPDARTLRFGCKDCCPENPATIGEYVRNEKAVAKIKYTQQWRRNRVASQ